MQLTHDHLKALYDLLQMQATELDLMAAAVRERDAAMEALRRELRARTMTSQDATPSLARNGYATFAEED